MECDGILPHGEIIQVDNHNRFGVQILVIFKSNCDSTAFTYRWIKGSDTCKVGQIVNIK